MSVNPIPDNYPRLSPYLCCDGAADAIEWYCKVLGASKRGDAFVQPDGKIGHAEIMFGDSVLMLSDEAPDFGALSPRTLGGTPVGLTLYVEDVDGSYSAAIASGATSDREPEDQFYGDRSCSIVDPWGHRWHIMSHIRDVSMEEMQSAMAAMGDGS